MEDVPGTIVMSHGILDDIGRHFRTKSVPCPSRAKHLVQSHAQAPNYHLQYLTSCYSVSGKLRHGISVTLAPYPYSGGLTTKHGVIHHQKWRFNKSTGRFFQTCAQNLDLQKDQIAP